MDRIFKAISRSISNIWLMLIAYLPGKLGFYLRYKYWKKRLKFLGNKVTIDTGVYFQNPNYIVINDNCWIDKQVVILAGIDESDREKVIIKNKDFKGEAGVVYIGENVHIGVGCIISGISAGVYISDNCGLSANCKIYAFSHHYRSKKNPENQNISFGPMVPHDQQCLIEGSVSLGVNTGIALNSVLLPGVSVPENCFIGINSVVFPKRFKSNSIISGNPATRTEARFITNE